MNQPGNREVLTRWIAYNDVEPIPFPWLQTATVAFESYRVAQYLAAKMGTELEPRSLGSFMPGGDQKTSPKVMDMDDAREWALRKIR